MVGNRPVNNAVGGRTGIMIIGCQSLKAIELRPRETSSFEHAG